MSAGGLATLEPLLAEPYILDVDHLFKQRQTGKVRGMVKLVAGLSVDQWEDVRWSDGWQVRETRLRLKGWSRNRRVIVARRSAPARRRRSPVQPELPLPDEPVRMNWEYTVLVTGGHPPAAALIQLYLERIRFSTSALSGSGPALACALRARSLGGRLGSPAIQTVGSGRGMRVRLTGRRV